VTLMTFDKQSNGHRTAVESKANHKQLSCNMKPPYYAECRSLIRSRLGDSCPSGLVLH